MTNLAICLLTFIDIMEDTRRNLPDISKPTWTDVIAFTQMIFSLAPVADHFWGYEIEAKISSDEEDAKPVFDNLEDELMSKVNGYEQDFKDMMTYLVEVENNVSGNDLKYIREMMGYSG